MRYVILDGFYGIRCVVCFLCFMFSFYILPLQSIDLSVFMMLSMILKNAIQFL